MLSPQGGELHEGKLFPGEVLLWSPQEQGHCNQKNLDLHSMLFLLLVLTLESYITSRSLDFSFYKMGAILSLTSQGIVKFK